METWPMAEGPLDGWSFDPQLGKLISLALNNREVFNVIGPVEARLQANAKVRCALIARQSKEDERKNAQYSIPLQQRENRHYAREQGFNIVTEIEDRTPPAPPSSGPTTGK